MSRISVIVPSIITIVLTGLAAIAWIVLLGGFGANNTKYHVFEILATAPPADKEMTIINLYPYFIVAILSPFLFILMVVKSILLLMPKRQMTSISIILGPFIIILACFVLIAGGAVFHFTSAVITTFRLISSPIHLDFISASFAGMFLETIFLIGGLIALYCATVFSAKSHTAEDNYGSRIKA
jgi:hypothetical protein